MQKMRNTKHTASTGSKCKQVATAGRPPDMSIREDELQTNLSSRSGLPTPIQGKNIDSIHNKYTYPANTATSINMIMETVMQPSVKKKTE